MANIVVANAATACAVVAYIVMAYLVVVHGVLVHRYAEAALICSAKGLRLCSQVEMRAGRTSGAYIVMTLYRHGPI